MLLREDKSERLTAAGVLAVVISPCAIACVYRLVSRHPETALLYAVPAICCGLLYLGLLRLFDLGSAFEMGLLALIVCIICVILVPVVIKMHTKHYTGSVVTGDDYHAARVTITNLSGV